MERCYIQSHSLKWCYLILCNPHIKKALKYVRLNHVKIVVNSKMNEYQDKGLKTTVCPRSSDPFYTVTYYMKWVTTSWTYSIIPSII